MGVQGIGIERFKFFENVRLSLVDVRTSRRSRNGERARVSCGGIPPALHAGSADRMRPDGVRLGGPWRQLGTGRRG